MNLNRPVNPTELLRQTRRIQLRTSHRVDDMLAGSWSSAFQGRGMEFEEVRPYQVGDDVRAIDWNVTARTGEPFVKLFREERELSVQLLVDGSGSLSIGTRTQTKHALVTELVATIALSAIKNQDKVGLTIFTDRIEKAVPPRSGSRHTLRLIRELLAWSSDHGGTDLAVGLRHLARTARRRSIVFFISDFQDDAFDRELRLACRRHDLIPVIVSDPRERHLPPVGLVRLRDVETGQLVTLDTSSRRHRQAYQRMAEEADQRRDAMLRRLQLQPLRLQTGQDIVSPLQRYLDQRERA